MFNNKTQAAGVVCAAFILLMGTGCLNTIFVASEDAHITTKRSETGRYFQLKIRNNFTFWGTKPHVRIIEIDRLVSDHRYKKVTKITGLKITQHMTFGNWLAQLFTIGIYTPRTLVIEGQTHEPAVGGG